MRNLRNIHRSLLKSPPGIEVTASAWDVGTDSVICAFGPTKENDLLELKRWKKYAKTMEPIASWDAPSPLPDVDCDKILDLHYFSDSLTACLVLVGGDLILVREDPQDGEGKIEIVGSVDAGISAAAWSPDEELLAVTTKASTLLYMTRDFENVADAILTTEDLKASNHVSVGWGKKETQFKGKKARALRDPTMPETVDEGVLSHLDSRNMTISWRGDGAYLAVNGIESNSRRIIRVYSREGILDSVSEPVDRLIGALSWRPAGNLLAGVQHLEDTVKVIFFERNGLRHGQFDLRLTKKEMESWTSVISLTWNVDSSVLAVSFRDRVQLWTIGNYHYYLKQEIFTLAEEPSTEPLLLRWHLEKPLHFTLNGVQRFAYSSVVSNSPTSPPDDYGVVAVIDGTNLKLSPLRFANVPPPMALREIVLEANAIDVAIKVDELDRPTIIVAVLHQTGLSLFDWPLEAISQTQPLLRWTLHLPKATDPPYTLCTQISFAEAEDIVLLQNNEEKFTVRTVGGDGVPYGYYHSPGRPVGGFVNRGSKLSSNVYLIPDKNKADQPLGLAGEGEEVNQHYGHLDMALQALPTQIIEAVSYGYKSQQVPNDSVNGEERVAAHDTIFSLAENGTLWANDRKIARSCTSFLVSPAHLIFTTSQHLVKFVHMIPNCNDLVIPPDTPETDERCRSIERGAKLVTVMPSIFALVMQMPRGNLETIYPRALVLAGIRDSINRGKYKKAFFACRNQRVDMNILHDYAPQQFISNVGLFIDQIKKTEYIDLFLSQLREENVSRTMYKETSRDILLEQSSAQPQTGHSLAQPKGKESKVNQVCDAFLKALEDRVSPHIQNIVTSHVCKIPPDLDAGLAQIARLREQKSEQIDTAVEHICFLADVNRLYDNALGLYDLELTLLIAQQSQKDPQEYLPFLQNLQQMPALRRQYSIDDYLGQFQKALTHLCNSDAFEEVKLYAVKHRLYLEALEFYRYQDGKLSEIMRLHANFLRQEGNFKEAGIAYEYLKDYTSASESFQQAHLWKESLSCATLNAMPQPQLHSLAQRLVDSLIESKDFFSAASVSLDYLSNVPNAARLFCKGYFFADALRIIGLHQRTDLLDSVIDQGLVEGMASMTELLADCKSQLNAQVPRIRELRAKKAEDPLAYFDGDVSGGADVPDNVSIAPTDTSTTGGSLFTRYTNRTGTVGTNATRRTSKNRKREERKRARGKKGSVYEEEYLVNSVGRLVERVNSIRDEVGRLVTGLMRRGMRERASAVEGAMVEVLESCKHCVGEVFEEGLKEVASEPREAQHEERPSRGDGVLWDTLLGERRPEAPVVKEFEKLSLLGR